MISNCGEKPRIQPTSFTIIVKISYIYSLQTDLLERQLPSLESVITAQLGIPLQQTPAPTQQTPAQTQKAPVPSPRAPVPAQQEPTPAQPAPASVQQAPVPVHQGPPKTMIKPPMHDKPRLTPPATDVSPHSSAYDFPCSDISITTNDTTLDFYGVLEGRPVEPCRAV